MERICAPTLPSRPLPAVLASSLAWWVSPLTRSLVSSAKTIHRSVTTRVYLLCLTPMKPLSRVSPPITAVTCSPPVGGGSAISDIGTSVPRGAAQVSPGRVGSASTPPTVDLLWHPDRELLGEDSAYMFTAAVALALLASLVVPAIATEAVSYTHL